MVRFPTQYDEILDRIGRIQPAKYARSRNFIDGAVSYLSPYISRGVISTRMVYEKVRERYADWRPVEKFIQELAWRDYWQLIWMEKGSSIDEDLKYQQVEVEHHQMPTAIYQASTGIDAIDNAIKAFYKGGYLHNHLRMYIAALACNVAKSHWNMPARWMYYHLLDADWASNALSWQWVAGTTRTRTYVANQDNINKYCHTKQKGTYLDIPYSTFANLKIPNPLREVGVPDLSSHLPSNSTLSLDSKIPTCLYNFYQLDPLWKKDVTANRVLLLEPSVFTKYPVSRASIDFLLELGQNIPNLQLYVGEFDVLVKQYKLKNIYYKEHPLNRHYVGTEESRDWICGVKGYYPSFFAFWKKCKREIKFDTT